MFLLYPCSGFQSVFGISTNVYSFAVGRDNEIDVTIFGRIVVVVFFVVVIIILKLIYYFVVVVGDCGGWRYNAWWMTVNAGSLMISIEREVGLLMVQNKRERFNLRCLDGLWRFTLQQRY